MSRPVGFHHSQETRERIRLSKIGKHYGTGMAKTIKGEQMRRARISKALTGYHPTEDIKLKLSESHKGIRASRLQLEILKLGHIAAQSMEARGKRKLSLLKVWQTRERKEKGTGKNHYNWQGGKSFEPYSVEFSEELKGEIRDRDNHIYQLCSVPEIECLKALNVHHIDYDKRNTERSNLISECLTLR